MSSLSLQTQTSKKVRVISTAICSWPRVYDINLTAIVTYSIRFARTPSTAEHAIAVRSIIMTCGYKQVKRYELLLPFILSFVYDINLTYYFILFYARRPPVTHIVCILLPRPLRSAVCRVSTLDAMPMPFKDRTNDLQRPTVEHRRIR
jgi:hypothetical protein